MQTKMISISFASALVLAACSDNEGRDGDAADDSTGASDTTGGDGTATVTATTATTIPTTSVTTATTDPETTDADSGEGETTGAPSEFDFDDAPPEDYARVDRMGMPMVAMLLVTMKDAYNEADPVAPKDDVFAAEIVENLDGLHAVLDDGLMAEGFTPCVLDVCIAQGGPLVLPDTLEIDLTKPAIFPNGRAPADPVVDLMLAVLLLDLGEHDSTTFADLPLNPPENDEELPAEFPFFAGPHE